MSSNIICSQCGASLDEKYRFCVECGLELDQITISSNNHVLSKPPTDVRRSAVESSKPFPTSYRTRGGINYKLLGLGMIIIIGFSGIVFISALTFFNSWWSDTFTYKIDLDQVTQVLVDAQGNIIVVGITNSENFPSTFSRILCNNFCTFLYFLYSISLSVP